MSLVLSSRNAQRWATARIALATLLIAGCMYAVIGHFASEVDRTRREQNCVGNVDRRITGVLAALDRARLGEVQIPASAERDAAEADVRELVRIEGRETTVGLSESLDQCLAAIDRETEALQRGDADRAMTESFDARPAHDRLRAELDGLDDRLQARAQGAVQATCVSTLATLLLSTALVAFFAARHQRRTAALGILEAQSQSSEARERRFRLLLEIEDATADLTEPHRVRLAVLGRIAAFFDATAAAKETVDASGRTLGEPITTGDAGSLPRLGPQDLVSLRAGRTKVHDDVLRCPLMNGADLRAVVTLRAAPGRAWESEAIVLVEEAVARLWAYHERAEAEDAKRQSRWTQALLEAQLDSSLDGILIVGAQNEKVLQNRRMAEVWGLPTDVADDVDDARQLALVVERVRNPEAFLASVQALYEQPAKVQQDEIELKDGTVLDRHTAPVTGPDGTILGRLWTFRDVTERVRAESALREAHEALEARVEERTRDLAAATHEAERANAAKSEFLSRMSHELRTPLNAILGFGQILDRQALDELQKESVHYILKGGRHLLGLINEVLDISRVETGHAELSIEPVPLADVLVESFAMVRTMAADRDVQLVNGFEHADELHVGADRQRLKQVFINLLSNAVKYNRPGGRVTARVSVRGDRLHIAIEDTGRGIPPEGLAKLFTPFERLEASATSIEGTGLGLFLTQKLVTTMGGELRVESVVGEGSTFAIELDLARSPAETLALVQGGAPESTDVRDGDRVYSILSIEDNSANVRLLEVVLANRPEILLTTENQGMAGFELARRTEPDLILLDLNLPDVSGTEVLTRLKRSATTSGIPVIVISADAGEDKVHINLKAGAAAFLTKPLDVDRFLATMDDALGIPRGEKRAA